ncbi:MAG: hypothetical protein U0990_10265 [Candidatus Nanopelagicales bacterium]|nr:hypothetical protein [Candidatus Nanopelagicales bacterium]MDZ4250458.1 hypothetical protein [Candidatus Nanopelagicales bacterium]
MEDPHALANTGTKLARRLPKAPTVAVGVLTVIALVLAACTSSPASPAPDLPPADSPEVIVPPPPPPPPPELPRGGRTIFPQYRLVGYSGVKGDPAEALGRLTGDLDARCLEIEKIGKKYAYGRQVMPVFEMIAVVVQASAGSDGKYRVPRPYSEVREYLRAARRCQALLLLNIQPGRSEFLPEMKHFEKILREPDVGVALDPEWAMDPGQIPGRSLGHSSGEELNAAAAYLSGIVKEYDLPEKAMVFHQFNLNTVSHIKALKPHEGVAIIRSVDGLGGPTMKTEEFNALTKGMPRYFHPGFKLFYKEDTNPPWGSRLMTPKEVMALKPRPEYILYE